MLGVSATTDISAGVSKMLVQLSACMPYEQAVKVYDELARVRVSASTAWMHTQGAGERARPALNPMTSQKHTASNAECVSIALDGFMAHVRREGWKEVKIGTVSEVTASGQSRVNAHGQVVEPVRAHAHSYVLHLGGPEGFGVKLLAEAQARHWERVSQSAVIGDGAAWIWNLATNDYTCAAHIVDWYHAKQHLCAAAELIYPQQPDKATAWVERHTDLLYAGSARDIADALWVLAAHANPEAKTKLETEAGYFATNHERMQYHDFQLARLPIGSGTVESAAKQAKHRLSAAGMRWSRTGLDNMLPLRAAVMSGTFDLMWPKICPR
jgi:hypothetical protein